MFKDNLFTENQICSSLLIILLSWAGSFPKQNILVSSAKRMNFSNVEIFYSIVLGPAIEPCGTPHNTFNKSKLLSSKCQHTVVSYASNFLSTHVQDNNTKSIKKNCQHIHIK